MELSDTGAVAEERWGAIHKVAFRFTFCYFLLYIFPLSGTLGWLWWSKPLVKYEGLWHKIVPWVGARVLHLTYAITIFPEVNGGSDTTYDYVKSFCFLVLAALATLVWTTIDRKRTAYPKLDHWLRWYVRLVLACALLVYGCGKVIPMQMPSPSLSTLMQPFGDPPLLTDNQRWQRMIFSSGQTLTIQEMNGKFSPYALSIDTQKSSLSLVRINPTLASSPWWSEWQSDITTYNAADPSVRSHEYAQLNYNRPEADAVTLEGLVNGHHLQVTLKKEQRSFLVKTLGFRWINDEYDFFNERVIE